MLSKRVIGLSPDKAFAKRMTAGVMAAGATVESFASLDEMPKELKADLAVVHLTDTKSAAVIEQVAARLTPPTPLIAIVPTSSLEAIVTAMKTGKVATVLVADTFEPSQLSKVTSRLMYGDLFGLEKMVPWGVKVYSLLVGDYQEKSVAISTVSEFAAAMGVRRKYRESIEQCLDELLMNALYDAPVDASGKHTVAEIPTKTRISLRMEQKAVVQYSCDGNVFALSVRDAYGTLKGDTVVKYLEKCLHSDNQIDRKTGGAGLGLYIISSASTEFVISMLPGVATEAVCTFDLNAPKVQLKEFGIFLEKIDSAGRLATPGASPAPRMPTPLPLAPATAVPAIAASGPGKGVMVLLTGAIALLLVLIGIVAYPRLMPAPRSPIAIKTVPPGASIELDGVVKGTTGAEPLVIQDLEVGQRYKVTATRPGYKPTIEIVEPKRDETAKFTLALDPKEVLVTIKSDPTGAKLYVDDKEIGTTEANLTTLQPQSEHRVKLTKVGYKDFEQTFRAPDPGGKQELSYTLQRADDVALLYIDSEPSGAEVLQGAEVLARRTPVSDYLVQVGRTYTFTVRLPGYRPDVRTVTVKAGAALEPIHAKLKPGGILTFETNVTDSRLSVVDVATCQNRMGPVMQCALEDGTYNVRIQGARPFVNDTVAVVVKGADAHKRVDYGFVETASPEISLRVPGAPGGVTKAAFPEGEFTLTLYNKGQLVIKNVRVYIGRTVRVDGQ
jgi:hypothetical protein